MHDEAEPTSYYIFTKKVKCRFTHESRCLMHDEAKPTRTNKFPHFYIKAEMPFFTLFPVTDAR
ncbi:hypothetical protein T11_3355 [Trichinella zimbabwensis]|uniref:Uncharacterized protein n=1 Tax=Trichinella zimbabwensis TaxID=268475 RepID=A0A0V1GCS3_9BILA|nr:hypothetical protein T11_3355 [Trichinella zimbabwensis]